MVAIEMNDHLLLVLIDHLVRYGYLRIIVDDADIQSCIRMM